MSYRPAESLLPRGVLLDPPAVGSRWVREAQQAPVEVKQPVRCKERYSVLSGFAERYDQRVGRHRHARSQARCQVRDRR